MLQRAKDDPGIEKFLDYFYKFCIDVLFRPVHDMPEYKDVTGMPATPRIVDGGR